MVLSVLVPKIQSEITKKRLLYCYQPFHLCTALCAARLTAPGGQRSFSLFNDTALMISTSYTLVVAKGPFKIEIEAEI
jgi:hypothetical protein